MSYPHVQAEMFIQFPGSDEKVSIGVVNVPLKIDPSGYGYEMTTDVRQIKEFVQSVYSTERERNADD